MQREHGEILEDHGDQSDNLNRKFDTQIKRADGREELLNNHDIRLKSVEAKI